MLLVIDANIAFAAILSSTSFTSALIFSPSCTLIAPEFFEGEFKKYLPELSERTGLSVLDVQISFNLLLLKIKIVPAVEYEQYRERAAKISPDPNDVEYFALALKFNCPLWSNDKRLKGQDEVKVVSTTELLALF